jgi:HlyD family secretion protein
MLQMLVRTPLNARVRLWEWVAKYMTGQTGRVGFTALSALAFVAVLAVGGYTLWSRQAAGSLPVGIAMSNGRVEAERVDVATKVAGRLAQVLAAEGDVVQSGQVLARMDTAQLEAQLREAEAGVKQAEQQHLQAMALLAQRESEQKLAAQELDRSLQLVTKGFTPHEIVDQRRAAKATAEAAVTSAKAQIDLAKAMIESAAARVQSIKSELNDAVLTTPRPGRVQYRLALPGEVLPAGGKVLSVLDLTDVYMTIFLPTKDAGRLELGSEARIVFDAAPQYVVPARITFVASDAQFTPKYVETANEREKLTFRIKVQVDREVLEKYATLAKTGVPGVAYVKVARDAIWPKRLEVRLPQ